LVGWSRIKGIGRIDGRVGLAALVYQDEVELRLAGAGFR